MTFLTSITVPFFKSLESYIKYYIKASVDPSKQAADQRSDRMIPGSVAAVVYVLDSKWT